MATVPYVAPKVDQSDTEYMFELRVSNIRAGAYSELLKYLSDMPFRVKTITEDMDKVEKQKALEKQEYGR